MTRDFDVFTTYRGRVTTVEVEFDDLYARGSSKLHPDDTFDYNIGFTLAYARAMERLGAKLLKRTIKRVNE